jgi:hypothetical protein
MENVNELDNKTLASYKKKAAADSMKAWDQGNMKRSDKRAKGVITATNRQFANDRKAYDARQNKTKNEEINMKDILESIEDMLDSIDLGNNIEAEKMFDQIMMTKIDDALTQRKAEIAQSMFSTNECADCEEEIEEELKGDQKNIDMNKNGKLDAQDFKMLRKKKKEMDEAVVSAAKRPMDSAAAKAAYQAERQRRQMQQASKPQTPAVAPKMKAKKVRSPEQERARQLAKADMRAMRGSNG